MYGVLAGDLTGFPYEYRHVDLKESGAALFKVPEKEPDASMAGTVFSDRTVLTAAAEEGLMRFEKRMAEIFAGKKETSGGPSSAGKTGASGELSSAGKTGTSGGASSAGKPAKEQSDAHRNVFDETYREEMTGAFRRTGQKYPLSGYAMDLSIWIFRDGAPPAEEEDAGPAARAVPVAWMFQEDMYLMRHMARLQALTTHRSAACARSAEAAACAVFLAIHGMTKDYIAQYLEKSFGYRRADEEAMRRELLMAGTGRQGAGSGAAAGTAAGQGERTGVSGSVPEQTDESLPALYVRAALTAFLYGRDFEDVLRRAVSLGGRSSEIAAIAGGMAEAFFGMPDRIRDDCRSCLPADLRAVADTFAARMEHRKKMREADPAMQARWENAMNRASERHPAAVQGNESLEEAIEAFRAKKDQQSFVTVLETIRMRMHAKGRVFVPLMSAKREDQAQAERKEEGRKQEDRTDEKVPANAMRYRMQAIRTKDGRLWQPVYTSRAHLDAGNAASGNGGAMVLSYAMDALLKRYLPAGAPAVDPADQAGGEQGAAAADSAGQVPARIEGIAINPYDSPFFLPRRTIEALFVVDRQAGRIHVEKV